MFNALQQRRWPLLLLWVVIIAAIVAAPTFCVFARRVFFYSSLGHNSHIFWNRPALEHFLAGIQFALGDLQVHGVGLDHQLRNVLRELAEERDLQG